MFPSLQIRAREAFAGALDRAVEFATLGEYRYLAVEPEVATDAPAELRETRRAAATPGRRPERALRAGRGTPARGGTGLVAVLDLLEEVRDVKADGALGMGRPGLAPGETGEQLGLAAQRELEGGLGMKARNEVGDVVPGDAAAGADRRDALQATCS